MASTEVGIYEGGGMTQARYGVGAELVSSRQAQEVQVAMLAAKRFPRNTIEAQNRILENCRRQSLAEASTYEFNRGGSKVAGPSIRLAEVMAQAWGNLDFGFNELSNEDGESTVMAYCWDLETNTRQTKTFTVPHIRKTKNGSYKLDDPRDIYEMVANQAARRVRSCILGIIPGDVVESAVAECQKTLAGKTKEPLKDRVRKMAEVFQTQFGVPLSAIEKFIGCNAAAFTEQSLVRLTGVYNSLKDGMAKREQYFDLSGGEGEAVKEEAAPAKKERKKAKQEQEEYAELPFTMGEAEADEWGEVSGGVTLDDI